LNDGNFANIKNLQMCITLNMITKIILLTYVHIPLYICFVLRHHTLTVKDIEVKLRYWVHSCGIFCFNTILKTYFSHYLHWFVFGMCDFILPKTIHTKSKYLPNTIDCL